ncbi:MAG TPA: TetR/AcrR family transcriptional regulator [Terriglobales bacterium]|nr:TetR/AcrR family transcriptional regulator [Terriglobales bacterium]
MPRRAARPKPEPAKHKKTDARVLRTRDRLGDALIALLKERPFRSITVQQVLERAGVGRATFYTHYRNKNDLLLSDLEEFLEGLASYLSRRKEKSDRIMPVREFCEHLLSARPVQQAFRDSGHWQDFWELAQDAFARGIERRLAELPRARTMAPARRRTHAQGHAGTLLGLLRFWLNRGMKESPEEMDSLFHGIVWREDSSR